VKTLPFWKYSGWLLSGFLGGIVLHSPWPYAKIGIQTLTMLACLLLILILGLKKTEYKKIAGIGCMILLGLWRFETAQLPQNLRWLDPSHFAYQYTESNPWRDQLTQRIQSGLPGDTGALLAGILYGDRVLSREMKEAFRVAGMSHIIAVSGSNVMLLVISISRILSWLRISRKNTLLILTFGLIAFVWIVSPQAPVMRAAIMGWLIIFAPFVGRLPSTKRLLLVSACIFTAWKPASLAYDPSFALSFLATIGLLVWSPWMDEKLSHWIPWKKTREVIAMTCATTLMTTPYAAWAFGRMGVLAIMTNILAVPLVPWALGTGILALIIPIAPFTWPAKGFLDVMLGIAQFVDRLSVGSWTVMTSPWTVFTSYFVIWLAWNKLSSDERNKFIHKAQAKNVSSNDVLDA